MLVTRYGQCFLGLAVMGLAVSFYLTWWKNPSRTNKLVFFAMAVVMLSMLSFRIGGGLARRPSSGTDRRTPAACPS